LDEVKAGCRLAFEARSLERRQPVSHKVPTHLRLLQGNPGRRPIPKGEPKPAIPDKPPSPPSFLSSYAVEEWKRVSVEVHALKLLSAIDVMPFAAYCEAVARWRTAEEALARMASNDPVMRGLIVKSKAGTAMENPLVYTSRRAAQEMLRVAAEFGFTPAARARIAGGFGPDPGPTFGKFGDMLA
jgi:P27 family predicted phage terminase small subunit